MKGVKSLKYSGLILNDISAAPGLCVSFFTQGCPHRCPGCHNPETWSFDGGLEFTEETLNEIINGLTAQNIKRDLCIMGGEPLCKENALLTFLIIKFFTNNKLFELIVSHVKQKEKRFLKIKWSSKKYDIIYCFLVIF